MVTLNHRRRVVEPHRRLFGVRQGPEGCLIARRGGKLWSSVVGGPRVVCRFGVVRRLWVVCRLGMVRRPGTSC